MKIVITGRNISAGESGVVELLQSAGHEVRDFSAANMSTGTAPQTVWEAVGDADAAIAGLEPYGRALLEHCPNLKLISRRGIGYDAVDLDACRAHGVAVARTTGTVEAAVAEHVLAYILYFARRVDAQSASMHRGEWVRTLMPGAKNRTLGLVGFGGIGKEIARRAVPFGMNVLYNCRHPDPAWETELGVRFAPLEELLAASDYLSLNLPLTAATEGMFGPEQFAQMKPDGVFLNISRSRIVDTAALRAALDSGRLRGAGVDVFDTEPCTNSPLAECPNALLTPHTAPYTSENFAAMNRLSARNVLDYFAGQLDEKYRVR